MTALNGALRDWFALVGGAVGKELPPLPPPKAVRRPTRYTNDFPAGVNYTSTRGIGEVSCNKVEGFTELFN